MIIHLLTIDPQQDFVLPTGSLYVNGAEKDMDRLASMIDRIGDKFDDIHVTLDSHRPLDIAHPIFWVNSEGKNPQPFTQITVSDVENGVWRPAIHGIRDRILAYVKSLEAQGQYTLMVWPEHCLIGSAGHAIYEPLFQSLCRWERRNIGLVDYVTKGSNLFTEHYGAIKAEVPDPADPSTQLNTALINVLESADIIAVCGEASSHCLRSTVYQIAENFDPKSIEKICLLRDATSPVVGAFDFTSHADAFIADMVSKGMKVSTTVDFLQ